MVDDARSADSQPPLHLGGADLLRLEKMLVDLFDAEALGSLGFYALGKELDEFSHAGATRLEVVRDLFQTAHDDERLRELLVTSREFGTRLETQKGDALVALSDELLASSTPPLVPPPPPKRPNAGVIAGGVVLAAVALIAAFLLWPRPGPVSPAATTAETPESMGTTATHVATEEIGRAFGRLAIDDLTIEDTLMLGDYCQELHDTAEVALACADVSAEALERMGKVVAITIRTTNYACELCRIEWTMFDAETNERVLFADFHNQAGWPYEYFTSLLPEDEFVVRNWVPVPDWQGTFFVQIELANDERQVFPPKRTTTFPGAPSTAYRLQPNDGMPATDRLA